MSAVVELLKKLDLNKDRRITEDEIEGLTLKACGYSWGGAGAVHFAQTISKPGTIKVGGSPKHPIVWELHVRIPVQTIFVFDPVDFLKPAGTVPSTVGNFYNYFQTKRGNTIFRSLGPYPDRVEEGTLLSRQLRGTSISVAAGVTAEQVDVTARSDIIRYRTFEGDLEYSLIGPDVNHDYLHWLVTPFFDQSF